MAGARVVRAAMLAMLGLGVGAAKAAENAEHGRELFRAHCMQCHGEKADGRGPLAHRFNPPPANIAATNKSDDYILQIVTLGGEALGRSGMMPEWGLELSGPEILDVVTYLRTVIDADRARRASATASAAGGKS
jgi:mono/diheme cytochrome c family protein